MIGAPNSLYLNCKVRVMKEAPGPSVSEDIVDIFTNYNIDDKNKNNNDNDDSNDNDDNGENNHHHNHNHNHSNNLTACWLYPFDSRLTGSSNMKCL